MSILLKIKRLFYKNTVLTPKKIENWLSFYEKDENKIQNLNNLELCLLNNGIPDVGNPYSTGTENYYKIHHGGFLCGEFYNSIYHDQFDDKEKTLEKRKNAFDRIALLNEYGATFLSVSQTIYKSNIQLATFYSLCKYSNCAKISSKSIETAVIHQILNPDYALGLFVLNNFGDELLKIPDDLKMPELSAVPDIDLINFRIAKNKF